MFDIITSRDFLKKLEADYLDFKAHPDSARLALNCIITAYHLHEWVWGDWLEGNDEVRNELGIGVEIKDFRSWLTTNWPGFEVLRKLTNGTKHFKREESDKTRRIAGYGVGPYGAGPYGHPYLLIDYVDISGSERWQTAEDLIGEAVAFWQGFFQTHQPPDQE